MGSLKVEIADTITSKMGLIGKKGSTGELSWTIDNKTLLLSKLQEDNQRQEIFSTTFDKIERADFSFNTLTFKVAGQSYTLYVQSKNQKSLENLGYLGGSQAFTIAAGAVTANEGGVDELRKALIGSGTKVTKPNVLRSILIGLIVGIVLIVGLFGTLIFIFT